MDQSECDSVTTARVRCGMSIRLTWQGRTIVRNVADVVGTVAYDWANTLVDSGPMVD
jgi:hypothetical protein